MGMKNKALKSTFIGMATLTLMLPFQNCSQKSIEFKPAPSVPEPPAPDVKTATLVVGQDELAPLKMIFVIDNSLSMKANFEKTKAAIVNMFDQTNSDNLSDFQVELFFMTTAQRITSSTVLDSTSIRSPASISSVDLSTARQSSLNTGLIAGDALGFSIIPTPLESEDSDSTLRVLRAAPLAQFSEDNGSLTPSFSIKFRRDSTMAGEVGNMAELLAQVERNLNVIHPDMTSSLGIASDSNSVDGQKAYSLDNEGGLCAVARALKDSETFVGEGDIASLILISDENDEDPAGTECLASIKKEKKIESAVCEKLGTNVTKYTVKYASHPGVARKKVTLDLFDSDYLKKKVQSTIKLTAKKSTCVIDYDEGYRITVNLNKPRYKITYKQRRPYPRRADSSSATYRDFEDKSTDMIYATAPSAGSCNLALLKSKDASVAAGDAQAPDKILYSNITCVQQTPETSTPSATYAFNHTSLSGVGIGSVDLTSPVSDFGVLPNDVQSWITSQMTTIAANNTGSALNVSHTFSSLRASKRTNRDITSIIASQSGAFFSSANCSNNGAVLSSICAMDQIKGQNCIFKSAFIATQSADVFSLPSLSADDTPFSCSSKCADFDDQSSSDLCAGEVNQNTKSVSTWANENGYTCSISTSNSNVDFTKQDNSAERKILAATLDNYNSETTNGGLSACEMKCSSLGLNCPQPNSKVSEQFRCNEILVEDIAAQQSLQVTLGSIFSPISCSSQCPSSLCGTFSGTVDAYISSLGSQCSTTQEVISGQTVVESSPITNMYSSEAYKLCSIENENVFLKPGESLRLESIVLAQSATTEVEKVASKIAGNDSPTLIQFIESKVSELFGEERFKFFGFIKKTNDTIGAHQSLGVKYDELATAISGETRSVDETSYNSSLSFLSGQIAGVLKRTYKVPGILRTQKVESVKITRYFDGSEIVLDPSEWVSKGKTVTIKSSVTLDELDQINITYK